MKKFLALIAALLIGSSLFAYDGTVNGGVDGIFVRKSWTLEASNPAVARNILQTVYANTDYKITKFYEVTKDIADKEDTQLIEDIEDYIESEYGVEHRTAYSHLVIRADSGDYVDGWIVLSHFTNADGFLHYVYYFCVE